MDEIRDLEKIVVLVDADNAQLSKLEAILAKVSTYGRIVVKKAYGNWKSTSMKNWEEEVKRLAIKPEQQFAYVAKKNATDIALVIGAMDLLNTKKYDAFVLVSSDSDYTPLAIRLREEGVFVFGAGEEKTPDSFKNACDVFVLTENLMIDNTKGAEKSPRQQKPEENTETVGIDLIHELLKKSSDEYQDGDGWVNISSAGAYIKRVKPDFDPLTYKFEKLTDLIKAYPHKYDTKKYQGKGTATIFAYKCK